MKVMAYPARIEQDADGRFVVTFPDLPYGATDGATLDEALFEAQDCLDEVIAGLLADDKELPEPSQGEHMIPVSPEIAMKYAVRKAFNESGWTRIDVARKLDINEKEVRRILDPGQPTKPKRMNQALRVFGKRIVVQIEDVA